MTSRLFDILEDLTTDEQQILTSLVEGAESEREQSRASYAGEEGVDIDTFYDLCASVIQEEQRLNKTGDRVFLRQCFSPDMMGQDEVLREFNVDNRPNDIISFKLLKRTPGTTKGTNIPHDRARRELNPHVRAIVPDEEYSGYQKYIYGQFFDNTVEFTIWSLTNKNADKVALWWEDVLYKWLWYFQVNRLEPMFYLGRAEDNKVSESMSTDKTMMKDIRLFNRPLIYFIRTEKRYVVKEKTLEQVFVNIHCTSN